MLPFRVWSCRPCLFGKHAQYSFSDLAFLRAQVELELVLVGNLPLATPLAHSDVASRRVCSWR